MSDIYLICAAHMRAMVARLGCLDAVAETINARFGESASKGTVSRKMNGSLEWSLKDVIALEDALGADPVSRAMGQRHAANKRAGVAVNGYLQAGAISRETGEAIAKILAAEQSNCAGDRAEALVEVDEAIAVLQAARDRLAAAMGGAG